MLAAYVSISVVLIVLGSVIAISSLFFVTTDDYVYENSSSSATVPASDNSFVQGNVHKLRSLVSRKLSGIGSESEAHPDLSSSSYYEDDTTFGLIFLLIVVMIFAFFLAYLKVYSVVLAWRLRKMILTTPATPLPTSDVTPQTHEFAPTNTSCAVPETEAPLPPVSPFQPGPLFAPGFAPYPYAMPVMTPPQMQGHFQGQLQSQFPHHHVMFGQQPVFYTYAPAPQAEEKL